MVGIGRGFVGHAKLASISSFIWFVFWLLVSCEQNSQIKVYRFPTPLEHIRTSAARRDADQHGRAPNAECLAPAAETAVTTPPNWERASVANASGKFSVKDDNGAAADISL